MEPPLTLFDARVEHRIPESARAAARTWGTRCHAQIEEIRQRLEPTRPPRQQRRPIARQLLDTADDLRRGVEPTMIARRLEALAGDIDPTVTGRIA